MIGEEGAAVVLGGQREPDAGSNVLFHSKIAEKKLSWGASLCPAM